jgi:hypothetical protein
MEMLTDGQRCRSRSLTEQRLSAYPYKIICTLNEMFILSRAMVGEMFYCVVQYVGPNVEANKFKYKFSLPLKQGRGKFSISHIVRSDTDDIEEICETADCVRIPADCLKFYLSVDASNFRSFYYFLEISKVNDTDA